MNIETQKLELIQLILALRENWELEEIKKILNGRGQKTTPTVAKGKKKKRQYGFAKGRTLYVAPDFDATPPGFEDYTQPQQAAQ